MVWLNEDSRVYDATVVSVCVWGGVCVRETGRARRVSSVGGTGTNQFNYIYKRRSDFPRRRKAALILVCFYHEAFQMLNQE